MPHPRGVGVEPKGQSSKWQVKPHPPHDHRLNSAMARSGPPLRVMEFYAGVGGFHWALKKAEINAEIVASVDINTNANCVYAHNFPSTPHLNRNICGMTASEMDSFKPDVFVLSPPCQPFTRQGLRRDNHDRRTDSFFHLMSILSEMQTPPSYLLMENVQGFETSHTREHFVGILCSLGYNVQEFLLSPNQFGIPNSRLRFYLLAKRKPLKFQLTLDQDDMTEKPVVDGASNSVCSSPSTDAEQLIQFVSEHEVQKPHIDGLEDGHIELSSTCTYGLEISSYLLTLSEDELSTYLVPDKILQKYAIAMDIVQPSSNHSCCFTKAYGNYALGTGSILQHSLGSAGLAEAFEEYSKLQQDQGKREEALECLRKLDLRYFAPKEVANLMCFPDQFCFPASLSRTQCYKVMGNSLNVHVVSVLMTYLFS